MKQSCMCIRERERAENHNSLGLWTAREVEMVLKSSNVQGTFWQIP